MSWYEQWFDTDEYDLVYQDRDQDEASTLVDLIEHTTGLGAGARILDVGCGRGRHSIEFARRGFRVTGLDLSLRALEIAKRKAVEADVSVDFLRGDMRRPAPGSYDLVVNLFTAFGYFEDPSDHQRAVDAMVQVLERGGWLVQDFLNAPYVAQNLVPRDIQRAGKVEIRQKRRIEDNRIRKRIEFIRDGEIHAFEESVALLTLDDFRRLYRSAGLTLKAVKGTYRGEPHTETSPRTILFSTRK